MTRYEESLEKGLPPMTSMEWLLLEMCCEDIFNGNVEPIDTEFLSELMMEIEHFYKDDKETLEKIKKILTK
jgi:hypothetical protein